MILPAPGVCRVFYAGGCDGALGIRACAAPELQHRKPASSRGCAGLVAVTLLAGVAQGCVWFSMLVVVVARWGFVPVQPLNAGIENLPTVGAL